MKTWCGRGDLNPHAFRRHPLKMVCLPVPPLPHIKLDFKSYHGLAFRGPSSLSPHIPHCDSSLGELTRRRDLAGPKQYA
jgi:hypothetical protein